MKYYTLAACYFIAILFLSTCGLEAAPLGMVTGPETGTYIGFGKDIARIAKLEGIEIEVKTSGGSIDNLRRIAGNGENAGLGIVQSDVLAFLGRSRNKQTQAMAEKLRMVMPFYEEEVHVLARTDMASFENLEGKRVVIGMLGSGNMLTAMNLLKLSNVKPRRTIQMPLPEGIVAVLTGDADAVIITGGAPISLLKNLDSLSEVDAGRNAYLLDSVHLLPINNVGILTEYDTNTISVENYDFVKRDVPTVSVTAIMVAYDFSDRRNAYYAERCDQLTKLGYAMRNHIGFLKNSAHPKWKQVDLMRTLSNWTPDECFSRAFDSSSLTNQNDLLSAVRGDTQQ